MSSNEAFLLMMRAAGATLVGETSGGSSGNPRRYPLPNGMQIVLPQWQSLTPDGAMIEGVGITPDIEVIEDAAPPDETLRRALVFLDGGVGGLSE